MFTCPKSGFELIRVLEPMGPHGPPRKKYWLALGTRTEVLFSHGGLIVLLCCFQVDPTSRKIARALRGLTYRAQRNNNLTIKDGPNVEIHSEHQLRPLQLGSLHWRSYPVRMYNIRNCHIY